MTTKAPPTIEQLLQNELNRETRPVAFVLAGHNGSGKSTLWYQRLAGSLQIPLVNADRLTMSILPEPSGSPPRIPAWAQTLRDENTTWQSLSQSGVRLFRELIMEQQQAFGFETVFSHWKELPNGEMESKIDDIKTMQSRGYMVVLIFVGLTALSLSIHSGYRTESERADTMFQSPSSPIGSRERRRPSARPLRLPTSP